MDKNTASSILSLLKLSENINIPEIVDKDIEYYLYEQYNNNKNRWVLRQYYKIKPLIPRFVQLLIRRRYVRLQVKNIFPAWPIETVIVDLIDAFLKRVIEHNRVDQVFRISPWPNNKKFAFIITHDVEWEDGLRHAPFLAKLENEYGFKSSWNIVPERYNIDQKIVDKLRDNGGEIGVHGFSHDGKLFQSYKKFIERVEKINNYAKAWGAVGFRSESTLRNVDWMPALDMEYDSSFPDTDPYEPHPGGCCSIWPFFIKHLVELPMTLPQDHTLFEILGHSDVSVWKHKVDWIESHGGMVLVNVHPDYMQSPQRIRLYENFLKYMSEKSNMWHVLPREVAQWWRNRHECSINNEEGKWKIRGPSSEKASLIVCDKS